MHFYAVQQISKSKRSFVAMFRNYSVTPTAFFCEKQNTKALKTERGSTSGVLFVEDDTNFETFDTISVSLFFSLHTQLVFSLTHQTLCFHSQTQRVHMPAEKPHTRTENTLTRTCTRTHAAASGADSILARLPYLFGSWGGRALGSTPV